MTGNTVLNFAGLPVWCGIQDRPGIRRELPFALEWDNRGFLRQPMDRKVRDVMVGAYAVDGYGFITPPPGRCAWGTRLGEQNLSAVSELLGPLDGSRVLEIGAGNSYVAERLIERHGAGSVTLIDPALRAADCAAEGIRIVTDYFPSAAPRGTKFDVIVSFSCLEHVEDPVTFLEALGDVLEDHGRVVVTFPDIGRQFRAGDLNSLLHEHMSYLDADSAAAMFARAGFTPIVARSCNDLFTYVLKKGAQAPAAPPRQPGDMASAFRSSLDRARKAVMGSLQSGERVAFHGANNGLNILLHHAGSAVSNWVTIFDGDEAKAGRFLPACPAPIRTVDDPRYRSIDRVFVAADSFYDEVRAALVQNHRIPESRIVRMFGASG